MFVTTLMGFKRKIYCLSCSLFSFCIIVFGFYVAKIITAARKDPKLPGHVRRSESHAKRLRLMR